MSYPIRYRFRNRITGRQIIRKNIRHNIPDKPFLFIDMHGTPHILNENRMIPISHSHYILEVAIEKDENGQWIYEQIGD